MKIKILQEQPVRGYQIPTFGMRELRKGELIEKDSKLGKALLTYFPSICKEVPEEDELLVEEPIASAEVQEVQEETPEVQEQVDIKEEEVPAQEETSKPKSKRGRKPKASNSTK